MLPDDDKDFIERSEIEFVFTVALALLIITAILAWVGA